MPHTPPKHPQEASKALTAAMSKIAPKIMTWRQIATYLGVEAKRRLLGKVAVAPYQPSFHESTIDHFLIHAGGL